MVLIEDRNVIHCASMFGLDLYREFDVTRVGTCGLFLSLMIIAVVS